MINKSKERKKRGMGITFIENEIEKILGKRDKLSRVFDLYESLGERLKEIILEEKNKIETVYLHRCSQEEKEKGKQDVKMTVEIDRSPTGNVDCVYLKKNGEYVFCTFYREDREDGTYLVKGDLSDMEKMSFAEYLEYDEDISPTNIHSQNYYTSFNNQSSLERAYNRKYEILRLMSKRDEVYENFYN